MFSVCPRGFLKTVDVFSLCKFVLKYSMKIVIGLYNITFDLYFPGLPAALSSVCVPPHDLVISSKTLDMLYYIYYINTVHHICLENCLGECLRLVCRSLNIYPKLLPEELERSFCFMHIYAKPFIIVLCMSSLNVWTIILNRHDDAVVVLLFLEMIDCKRRNFDRRLFDKWSNDHDTFSQFA